MSCMKFRILLSSYLDQEITKDEEKKLLQHLQTCPDCARELEHLEKIKRIFLLKERKEPREFFETRLFEHIKNRTKQPVWRSYFPVFRRTVVVILVLFLVIVGWVNYRKLFYPRTTEIISDLLLDEEINENFEQELLEAYYGPLG